MRRARDLPNIEFLVHPLPGTQEQLQEKLKELANKINNKNEQGKLIIMIILMCKGKPHCYVSKLHILD